MTAEAPPAPPDLRIVVARYGPGVIGGAESHARQVAERLAGRGREVEVLTTCALDEADWANRLPPGEERLGGVLVRRFPVAMRRRERLFRQGSRLFFRLPRRWRPERLWLAAQGPLSPALERALAAAPPAPTLFVTYLYRTTIEGTRRIRGPRLLLPTAHPERPLHLRAVGAMLGRVEAIWYATPEERALLEGVHPAAAGAAAAVGNVGVEPPAAPDPARFRAAHGIEGDYLLYGGRATAGKGLEELLAGFAALRTAGASASLVLTGEAGSPGIGAAPDGVLRLGRLDEGDRWDAIAGAAAVVVASRQESLSLLALEAWACGRPALLQAASPALAGQAARSGGGLTFEGVPGLAAAARRLLDDPGLAARLGEAGRRHVAQTYRWDQALDRLEALIATAAGRRRPG